MIGRLSAFDLPRRVTLSLPQVSRFCFFFSCMATSVVRVLFLATLSPVGGLSVPVTATFALRGGRGCVDGWH